MTTLTSFKNSQRTLESPKLLLKIILRSLKPHCVVAESVRPSLGPPDSLLTFDLQPITSRQILTAL